MHHERIGRLAIPAKVPNVRTIVPFTRTIFENHYKNNKKCGVSNSTPHLPMERIGPEENKIPQLSSFPAPRYYNVRLLGDEIDWRKIMGKIAISCGVILILVGLAGYFGVSPHDSSTLLPVFFGVLLCVAGGVATGYPKAKMHAMHAAVLIAMFEFVAASAKALSAMRDKNEGISPVIPLITLLVCIAFVIMSVRSFIEARRHRTQGIEGAPGESL
jgi:hypothetical protein